ncbi:hypothetical protein D9V41_00440 [Aeromicrobium phragmitis]|uniref:Uncharacterized protein n=1 Tax=Aeromicrobium phragmitis TaxID=2478914 RepID=A0A3L8PPQ2_9ACTN|nr:YbaY family lipoprotein [Aeromicrobium phragmitis]RLV57164.1 hypothetical protein D9V41_00440 [Aeromicrobium phragmitis]
MESGLVEITGTLEIDAETTFDPAAVATVKLADSDGEVLAAAAFEVAEIPASFALTVDASAVPRPDRLFLWALVRVGKDGWGTLELARVSGDHTTLTLSRVPAA